MAAGWSIALAHQAPKIQYPTAIVVAPDGTVYLGQDPMNMPGPVTAPIDSVLAIRPDGSTRTFAAKLQSVMGLEWVDGALIVVHAPFLSSFRDTDGDGMADRRIDLVTGLGPAVPGSNGLNDHIASGVRLAMDGFLYLSVGDKGIPRAKGTDGRTITLSTGGVIRVRPDGTDLEVVSTGERNPLSVALSDRDDVWTFGNDDDSHLWPNSLTYHIVGGHYGYPYEFRTQPHRALPIVAGQSGGAGAQGVCSNSGALPAQFRGNLFFCDWGLQSLARYEVEPQGGSFRLVKREAIIERGDLADFRPFSIAPTLEGDGFWVVDWAYNGWLGTGPPTGRLFRLTYTGPDRLPPLRRQQFHWPLEVQLGHLNDPTLSVRLANQRLLTGRGEKAVEPLANVLANRVRIGVAEGQDRQPSESARVHALWALDAINLPTARVAIRGAMSDLDPAIRAQAIRSGGIRRDAAAEPTLVRALADPDAPVRREAAIALGRLPTLAPASQAALFGALKENDPVVAWSIRRAIRSQPADQAALATATADPARRDSALTLADGWYSPEVVRSLTDALTTATKTNIDPTWRARLTAAIGGLYAKIPPPSGQWFGSDPVAGPRPKATEPWDKPSMDLALVAVGRSLRDGDATVRRQAIIAAINVGPRATPLLRLLVEPGAEADPLNLVAVLRQLADQRDTKAAPAVAKVLADTQRPEEVRLAALDALGQMNGPVAINARLMVLYDAASPESLIVRALPALGRAKLLPGNDLVGFLDHASSAVRAAALAAFPVDKPLTPAVVESILLHVDDPSPEVRTALAQAAGMHRIKEAIPHLVRWALDDGPTRSGAIRALATMPDRRGLTAYVAALNDRDPDLRRSGLAALTAIRAQVAPELAKMARQGEFVGPGALLIERLLGTFRPLVEWRVIGPFPRATGPIFADPRSINFARTEPGADGKPVTWRPRLADPKTGTMNLDDIVTSSPTSGSPASAEGLTAFAVAEVTSDRDRPAILVIDASGPVVVVVDERPLANFVAGAAGETLRVDLRSGVNRILLRTRQALSPWSARVQLSEPDPAGTPGPIARVVPIQREGLRAFAQKRSGDPKNGALIFHELAGVGCARCHAVGGKPASHPGIGPDLTGLALKYDKAEIIRSILEPSNRIAVGYVPTTIARTDGSILTGLPRAATLDAVNLALADGQIVRVARDQISQERTAEASVMPEGLVDGLKPVEFADLVAYLLTLKESSPVR